MDYQRSEIHHGLLTRCGFEAERELQSPHTFESRLT